MTTTLRTILLWLSLVFVTFLAWQFAQVRGTEETMAFSDFLASVDAGEVRSVRVDLLSKGPGAVFRVSMTDGRRLRVTGLYSDALLQSLRATEVPIVVRWDEGSTWPTIAASWLPILLVLGFFLFFILKAKSGGTNLDTARKAVTVRLDSEEPRVSSAELSGGAAAAFHELRALVRTIPPAPVLLTGQSGCGKTHLLRALAADLPSPCLLADGASFAEIFLGVAAARVRDLFAQGRNLSVAFVALDGIDDICRSRAFDSRGERDERTQAMLQLSTSLDEIATATRKPASILSLKGRPKPTFTFVGVTNRADLIDPAILRRFARVVTLGPPDIEERASILASLLQHAGAPDDIDVRGVASRTEGWERGDLRTCVDDAVRTAADHPLSAVDIDAAVTARERVRSLFRAQPA